MTMANGVGIEPPRPQPDGLSEGLWEGWRQHRFVLQQCSSCRRYVHYPKPVCRFCLGTDLAPAELSGRGTVYSFTVAVQPFHPYYADKVPYLLATVELAEQAGLMFFTRLVGMTEDEVRVGMPVAVAFDDLAPDLAVPVFGPATES